jgi:hypothetical protein
VLPHVREWTAKYRHRRLIVVGGQTAELAFERNLRNISDAVVAPGVKDPMAIDNEFQIWNAFANNEWPALYFIEADGQIHHQMQGEADYKNSEREIQQPLSGAAGTAVANAIVGVNGHGPEAAADIRDQESPETYVDYAKSMRFASRGPNRGEAPKLYSSPATLPLNQWKLGGDWTNAGEFAALNTAGGRISYRFHARDLHRVLGNSSQGHPVRFRITIDAAPPGADHGSDVDADVRGVLNQDRLYQLVRQAGPVVDRTFETEFLDSGLRTYALTGG